MPDPISSTIVANNHYDHEAGQCLAEPQPSPTGPAERPVGTASTPPSAVVSTPDQEPSQSAVDQLVAGHTRSTDEGWYDRECLGASVKTLGTCAGAVSLALSAPTGVGLIPAVLAGASCGVSLADAEAACR